ncbi:protein TolR [Legionella yabuuchiae]|uniref:protein TolR n=1 Tax=Legionella yabuuchiae TaxID=376727 RepID=UPI0010554831|nr:protein TolR [Legionella yabuuchiae]
MLKKNNSRSRPMAEINVVPYIDVMLVLLVIFMITAPLLTQGVTVDLPKAASEPVQTTEREPIIVSVNRDGEYFLNISANPNLPIEPQKLMVRVAAELGLARQAKAPINILVKGDQGVSYGKVVVAMSLLKKAGAEQVGLITDSSDQSEESIA